MSIQVRICFDLTIPKTFKIIEVIFLLWFADQLTEQILNRDIPLCFVLFICLLFITY